MSVRLFGWLVCWFGWLAVCLLACLLVCLSVYSRRSTTGSARTKVTRCHIMVSYVLIVLVVVVVVLVLVLVLVLVVVVVDDVVVPGQIL